MELRSLPEAIKSIMQTRGWSQARLARELGMSEDWVSKVKRGERDPSIGKMARLLTGIGWEVVIRPKRETSPVKRRDFVAAAASVMFVPSPKVGPYEDPANVRELARRVSSARQEHGGTTIAASAMRHVRRIESAVAGRDGQLQEAASELAVEAVWTLTDAHYFDAGENVGRLALELAKLSTSADAQSRAYSALTAINVERGRADRALTYAREGVRLPEVSEAQHAWMRIRKARALALVRGQQHTARDELAGIQEPLRHTQGFSGQSPFDVADMIGNVGKTLNGLGLHADAHTTLDEAVTLLGASSPNPQSHFLAQQVIAALRMSHVSLAANHMLALARVAPLVNSRRLDEYLRHVLAESATWATVPEVRDARNQLKALILADSHRSGSEKPAPATGP